jgi:tape measure domain-containing protein
MAVISSNEIVVGYKVVGQAELQQLAAQFEKITNTQAESLEEFRKVNNKVKETTESLKENAKTGVKAGNETSKAFKDTEQSAGKLSSTLKDIGPLIATVFSVAAIKAFATQVITTTANFQGLRTSIDFASGSMKEGAKNFSFIIDLSQRFGKDLQTLAGAYSSFSASSRLAGITQEKSNYIFESAVKASTALGKSNADTQGILLAFSQIVSKGTVQAEELRGQIGERLPGAFNLAAKAMGVTTKELNKMLEQGQVISADFLPKFAKELDNAFGDAALSKVNSITAATGRLGTAWDRFIESVGSRGEGFFTEALSRTAKFIDLIRESITDNEKLVQDSAVKIAREAKDSVLNSEIAKNKELEKIDLILYKSRTERSLRENEEAYKLAKFRLSLEQNLADAAKENQSILSIGSTQALIDANKAVELRKKEIENIIYENARIKGLIEGYDTLIAQKNETSKIVEKSQAELKKEYEIRLKNLEQVKQIRTIELELQGVPEGALLAEKAFLDSKYQLQKEYVGRVQSLTQSDLELTEKQKLKAIANLDSVYNKMLMTQKLNLDEIKKGTKESGDALETEQQAGIRRMKEWSKNYETQQKAEVEAQKKADKTKKQLRKELNEQIQDLAVDSINSSFDLYQQGLQRELSISNQKYNEEIRLADGNEQKITEINEKRAAKDKEIALKQFRAGQLQAIAQAGFQAAPYIVKYTALLPASAANLALTIGALAAQTGFILAQQPPEFYKGVENFEGGFAKVGERGSELIETPKGTYLSPDKPTLTYLPKGTNVITASKTKERMQILNSTYKKGQDQFQTIDTSPIAAELSKMPVAINRFDENGFTQYVRKGNRTTQILNKRKNY